MSEKSSAARSMTSSMTIPMSNSGDSSVTLPDDSFNDTSHSDDDNIGDITYITKVKNSLKQSHNNFIRLTIHHKSLTKVKQL